MIDPERIFQIRSRIEFEELALEIFHVQAETIPVYKEFIHHLGIVPARIDHVSDIPFLPVEFFKSHEIIDPSHKARIIFKSSGTTGGVPSTHFVADPLIYEKSIINCFRLFYGEPENYCFLALLPSFPERSDSSLVYMTEKLIRLSRDPDSGFYLNDTEKLMAILEKKNSAGNQVILLGVSFALVDLAKSCHKQLPNIIFMETGGMKGRRKEMVREELHMLIKENFGIHQVHSEYGMTELLSQAYSERDGIFYAPPWMKISIRDIHDPSQILKPFKTGRVNIIDLANIYSCSFLSTSDLGRVLPDGSFEITGRTDNSDLRGCNLMIT